MERVTGVPPSKFPLYGTGFWDRPSKLDKSRTHARHAILFAAGTQPRASRARSAPVHDALS